jgi:hypothetical protein
MSVSSRPLVLLGAIMATSLCLFLAFQAAALLLPYVLSTSYRWILAPLSVLLIAFVAYLRVRKRHKAALSSR